jgi:hypothetical protein
MNENVFSDEDLMKLEEALKDYPGWATEQPPMYWRMLLVRLDAAEKFIWGHKDPILHNKLLEAWRQASGKTAESDGK